VEMLIHADLKGKIALDDITVRGRRGWLTIKNLYCGVRWLSRDMHCGLTTLCPWLWPFVPKIS